MGPAPKPLVLELAAVLPRAGRALDIACGEGQLAAWLAHRGLEVTAVDISPVALDKLRAQADAEGFAERLSTVEADLDRRAAAAGSGPGAGDMHRLLRPGVMAQARELLAPGGMLLLQVLLQPPGGDSPHRVARGAALELAAGLRLLFYGRG
jgi:SAM-dependent methyltransferase